MNINSANISNDTWRDTNAAATYKLMRSPWETAVWGPGLASSSQERTEIIKDECFAVSIIRTPLPSPNSPRDPLLLRSTRREHHPVPLSPGELGTQRQCNELVRVDKNTKIMQRCWQKTQKQCNKLTLILKNCHQHCIHLVPLHSRSRRCFASPARPYCTWWTRHQVCRFLRLTSTYLKSNEETVPRGCWMGS